MKIKDLFGENYKQNLELCTSPEKLFEIIKEEKLPFNFEQAKAMFAMLKKEAAKPQNQNTNHKEALSNDEIDNVTGGSLTFIDPRDEQAQYYCRIKIICINHSQWAPGSNYLDGCVKSCENCVYSQKVPFADTK